MSDLISRQAAIDAMAELQGRASTKAELKGISKAWKRIKKLPSAQPKRGRWIEKECGTEEKEEGWETVIVCSRCDFPATTFYSEDCESRTQIRTHFCPNCGAKMEGVSNGN